MDFVALHDAVRRRLRTGEAATTGLSVDDSIPALSSGEESALALLWQQLGRVGGDIDGLIAKIGVLEWAVPAGRIDER